MRELPDSPLSAVHAVSMRRFRLVAIVLVALLAVSAVGVAFAHPATAAAATSKSKSSKSKTKTKTCTKARAKKKLCKPKSKGHTASPKPNSGLPGSRCIPAILTPAPNTDPAGVDTNALGPAPVEYEVGQPTGKFAGKKGKRVMILIHGGGWYITGHNALAAERPFANAWRSRGWTTVNIDYRACQGSVGDVVHMYDLVRGNVGPNVPICLQGESAGGHLALMVAAARSDVACVSVAGTPTDLAYIAKQGANEAASGNGAPGIAKGAAKTRNFAIAAFGKANLATSSPTTYAKDIRARVLIATAAGDDLIPYGQAEELAAAIAEGNPNPYVDIVRMAPGDVASIHAGVSQAAADDYANRLTQLVDPIVRATTSLLDQIFGLSPIKGFPFFGLGGRLPF
jgi:acetyl esterase/lipase